MKPITGSINKVIKMSLKADVDYIYSDDHAIIEVMEEYSVSRNEAIEMIKQAQEQMIKEELEILIKEGVVEIVGHNEAGEPLYNLVKNKTKKKK